MSGEVLVEVEDLHVRFPVHAPGSRRRVVDEVRAVDGIDLEIRRGETLGVVGESGCGKSTLGNALLRLVEPTAGRVVFDGHDITSMSARQMRALRRRMAMVFQDPYASLDPRFTIGQTIAEPLDVHRLHEGKQARRERVGELLELVGLDPRWQGRRPHELSGGQRQRVGIARALAGEPDLVVCDEPVASLDVSIQAQVLNLLAGLQRELGLTYVFIAHDLAVVEHLSDRIAVMYLGRIVEEGPADAVVDDAGHPYTEALLSAIPEPDPPKARSGRRIVLQGDVPSPTDPPSGCRFRTRCPKVFDACDKIDPDLQPLGDEHRAACLLHGLVGRPVDDDAVGADSSGAGAEPA